jgi:hypothetical protein
MADLNITEWLKALGPFQPIILLLAFAAPGMVGWTMPSGLSEYLNPALMSLGITFIAFFSSASNFAGPLRYGISKYGPSLHEFYQKSPDGTIWVLVLLRAILPWTQTWLVSVVAITWQYTLQHFREEVRAAMDVVNDIHARAIIAATSARDDVEAALRYEKDTLQNSSEAIRDARLADGIKASDFFDAATGAWAAIRTASDSITRAKVYSSGAATEAENARQNLVSSYHSSSAITAINNSAGYTNSASSSAVSAENSVEVAMNVITDFRTARNSDESARQQLKGHESQVREGARELLEETESLRGDLARLQKDVQVVRHKANLVVAKAEEGRMGIAKTLAKEATDKLNELEKEAGRIAGVKDEVRKIYVSLILGTK